MVEGDILQIILRDVIARYDRCRFLVRNRDCKEHSGRTDGMKEFDRHA